MNNIRNINPIVFFNKYCKEIFSRSKYSNSSNVQPTKVPVKEIKIPVPWGYVAGKLWGDTQRRPVLALHGWQDNAGTWDTLAPLIAHKVPVLAIDFPGHGLSSWIPSGVQYCPWDIYGRLVLMTKRYFKWKKVSLLGHSLGSMCAMRFACVFPDDVDFYIGIECLFVEDCNLEDFVGALPNLVLKIQRAEDHPISEPPLYSLDEIYKKWHNGSNKSVSLESVKYLAKRGIKASSSSPDKYFFTKDPRVSMGFFYPENKNFLETLGKCLKCPTLYIKATDSEFATSRFAIDLRSTLEKSKPHFSSVFVPGSHHVHLNNPNVVLPHILEFLSVYKFI